MPRQRTTATSCWTVNGSWSLPPNLNHESVWCLLGHQLGNHIIDRGLGKLFYAPCDVQLSDNDVVQPDLLFVSREREHLLSGDQHVQGASNLRGRDPLSLDCGEGSRPKHAKAQ